MLIWLISYLSKFQWARICPKTTSQQQSLVVGLVRLHLRPPDRLSPRSQPPERRTDHNGHHYRDLRNGPTTTRRTTRTSASSMAQAPQRPQRNQILCRPTRATTTRWQLTGKSLATRRRRLAAAADWPPLRWRSRSPRAPPSSVQWLKAQRRGTAFAKVLLTRLRSSEGKFLSLKDL